MWPGIARQSVASTVSALEIGLMTAESIKYSIYMENSHQVLSCPFALFTAVESVFNACSMHDYGFDPSAPVPLEEENYQVVVPETTVPLSGQQIAFLESHCNPLQENDRSGENTYLDCLRILYSLLSQDIYQLN